MSLPQTTLALSQIPGSTPPERVRGQPLLPAPAEATCRPAGRLSFVFTYRLLAYLVPGLIPLAAAGPKAWWLAAAWDILILTVLCVEWLRLPRPSDLVARREFLDPLGIGMTSRVRIELRSRATRGARRARNLAAVRIKDHFPDQFEAPVQAEIRWAGQQSGHGLYSVRPRQRGTYAFGDLYLRYRGTPGLVVRLVRASVGQTVRVYPNLEEAQKHALFLTRSRQVEMEKRYRRLRGRGREFESLREWVEGDEPRDICWTATSRAARLMVRQYQFERSQQVMILMDAGRLMQSKIGDWSKLDHAVNSALALAQVALRVGDRVGLMIYGARVKQFLPPGGGPAQLRAILELLEGVVAEPVEPNYRRAVDTLLARMKKRALVVLFTDLAESAGVPDLVLYSSRMMHRHLPLVLALQHPELVELAESAPASAKEIYRQGAAVELLARRERQIHKLQELGVLAMDTLPDRLSLQAISQYLEVKERALL